ncbi:MAG: leucine-rich repeat domain-containing protein [Kiritimatiellae bacterium]|nr:leucine-rich repeat domain-containing protein [Kiritimatiellia bacterium]
MKRVLLTVAATFALVTAAMPTKDELRKAEPLVMELMKPLVESYNTKKKSATEVGDSAMTYAHKADTEAAQFLLFKGAVWYYAQDKADDKAVTAITELRAKVKDIPPEVIRNEILRPAVNKVSAQSVPGLFTQYRVASARVEIAKLEPSVRRGRADETTRRRYAELLAVADDWKAALAAFAELKDAKTAQIAKDELAGKTLAPAADFWWDYKPTEDMATEPIKAHAAALYLKTIASGELTGLKKVIAEKRMKEMGKDMPTTTATSAIAHRENITPAASATPDGKYKFNYKLDDKGNAILCGEPCVSPKPEGVLVIPDKIDGHMVTKIDSVAFKDCDKMTRIVLPPHLEQILYAAHWTGGDAPGAIFRGCSALESIEISKANPIYVSEKGALYTVMRKSWVARDSVYITEGMALIAYPKNRSEIILARETTRVLSSAFHSCMFKTARLPDSVEQLGFRTFENCPNLEIVEFPKSLKRILPYAFIGCLNMKKVVFNGDAPLTDARRTRGRENLFFGSPKDIVVEVKKGSKGWKAEGSTELPERWPSTGSDSRPIRYIK